MNVAIHKIAGIFNFVTVNSNIEESDIEELINKIILSNKVWFFSFLPYIKGNLIKILGKIRQFAGEGKNY